MDTSKESSSEVFEETFYHQQSQTEEQRLSQRGHKTFIHRVAQISAGQVPEQLLT